MSQMWNLLVNLLWIFYHLQCLYLMGYQLCRFNNNKSKKKQLFLFVMMCIFLFLSSNNLLYNLFSIVCSKKSTICWIFSYCFWILNVSSHFEWSSHDWFSIFAWVYSKVNYQRRTQCWTHLFVCLIGHVVAEVNWFSESR